MECNQKLLYMVIDEFGTHCCVSEDINLCIKVAKDLANEQGRPWYVGDSKSQFENIEILPDKE